MAFGAGVEDGPEDTVGGESCMVDDHGFHGARLSLPMLVVVATEVSVSSVRRLLRWSTAVQMVHRRAATETSWCSATGSGSQPW